MVEIGSGARRELPDVRLSHYTCYLIVQNGNPSKPVIDHDQTKFARRWSNSAAPCPRICPNPSPAFSRSNL